MPARQVRGRQTRDDRHGRQRWARAEQAEKGRQGVRQAMVGRKGQAGKGQLGKGRQVRAGREGQAWKGRQERTSREGQKQLTGLTSNSCSIKSVKPTEASLASTAKEICNQTL